MAGGELALRGGSARDYSAGSARVARRQRSRFQRAALALRGGSARDFRGQRSRWQRSRYGAGSTRVRFALTTNLSASVSVPLRFTSRMKFAPFTACASAALTTSISDSETLPLAL